MTPAPADFRQQLLVALPRLRRYARALTQNPVHSDDLCQATVERALTRWHQFEPGRDLVVWLLSIAHNAWADERRRDARLSVLDPADLAEAQDARGGASGPDVGLRMDLLAALQRLPVEQRTVLLLVCVEQLSYAECAEVLAIPIGTVMSRVSRARSQMRAWLDGGSAGGSPALRRVV